MIMEGEAPGKMPAAVFIAQAIIRKGGYRIGLAGRQGVSGIIKIPAKGSRFRDIDIILSVLPVKSHLIGIMKAAQVGVDVFERSSCTVPVFENIDLPSFIIAGIVHIRSEQAPVRAFCQKSQPSQTFERDADPVPRWNAKRKIHAFL